MSTFQGKQGLDGVCAKLARAHQHLEEFQATSDAWVDSSPYAIRREFDPESGWIRFVWVIFKPPPAQFGVILGDYLNNLRGVLDHMIAALVKRFGESVTWGHAFPILIAEKDWPNDPNWSKLAGIPLGWQAVIKCLQPYHRRDDPKQHPLAVLNILNNADKHRTLPPLVTAPSEFDVEGTKPDGASIEYRFLPPFTRLEEGTELYAVRADPPSDFDVRVNPDVTVQIAFEYEGLSGVFGDLPELFEAVQHVLVCLLPAFD